MRRSVVVAVLLAVVLTVPGANATPLASETAARHRGTAYQADVRRLPAPIRTLMIGRSWHAGCPVPLRDLRLITLTYWGFDRTPHTGKLVVH